MRRIDEQAHQHTSESASNRDSKDPADQKESDSVPVDGLECAVTETDTDGGAGDAHRCRNGERKLRKEKDSNGGTKFHRGTSARGVVGNLVSHDCCAS